MFHTFVLKFSHAKVRTINAEHFLDEMDSQADRIQQLQKTVDKLVDIHSGFYK